MIPYCSLLDHNNVPLWSPDEGETVRENTEREGKGMSQIESWEKLRGDRGKEKGGRKGEKEGGSKAGVC